MKFGGPPKGGVWTPKIDRATWPFLNFDMRHGHLSDMRHGYFLKSTCDIGLKSLVTCDRGVSC